MILNKKEQNIVKDLENLEDISDFSNLDENHELLCKKKQKGNWYI